MLERNAIGRIVAFARAEAADADFAMPASPTPSVAKHPAPTTNVSNIAGSFANSTLTS